MPTFGLFPKQKKQEQTNQVAENIPETQLDQTKEETVQKTHIEENTSKKIQHDNPTENQIVTSTTFETTSVTSVKPEVAIQTGICKTYLKAIPLRDISDLDDIKTEIQNDNILILRITPLASKSIESVKSAVNELYSFTESIGGDIARLGEERIVICPKNIKIWREKVPVKNELLPTTVA
ncbi:MAG: cell division protein SepF [Candidatus Bathyarchaeota archaeon]|nr:cell division protein SepF [Candidatus Termiticorpusculum sp.]